MLTLPFFYLLTLSRATFEIPVCHHYGLMVLPRLVAFQIILIVNFAIVRTASDKPPAGYAAGATTRR